MPPLQAALVDRLLVGLVSPESAKYPVLRLRRRRRLGQRRRGDIVVGAQPGDVGKRPEVRPAERCVVRRDDSALT